MKKNINGKALLGIGAGIVTTIVGAICLFAKKHDNEYVESDVDDNDIENVDESVEEPEE